MKLGSRLRGAIVLCIAAQTLFAGAQGRAAAAAQAPAAQTALATGSVTGVVRDPAGAVVVGARVTLAGANPANQQSAQSDPTGHFAFSGVPAGRWVLTITSPGFNAEVLPDLVVTPGQPAHADASLALAPVNTEIEVSVTGPAALDAQQPFVTLADRAAARNATELLEDVPGVSLRGNGVLASIPELHGMGDERTRVSADGMAVSSSCPNHMNPPLTYIAPAAAAHITVMAGITPVSSGGDSLGGTIAVDAAAPAFAATGERWHPEASIGTFYRSNGHNAGGFADAALGGRKVSFAYSGSFTNARDYADGDGQTVTSTYAQSENHTLTLAGKAGGNLLELTAGLHHTPYQGFVNERMDMVRNFALSLNLDERRSIGTGMLDARVFWQSTSHTMNAGHDKAIFPMAMTMPMNDHGTDTGYAVTFAMPLGRQTLRIGNELHRFVLNDAWPPVMGMAPTMGPETFVDINDGRRTRVGTWVEAESRWNSQWSTVVGVRDDTVGSNAGAVHGYSDLYAMDAQAFNAAPRAHTDVDWDATALARCARGRAAIFELGFARKTRAPNLYERYWWTTDAMTSSMLGWFGDGNGYVGNVALRPEAGETFSGTLTLHDRAGDAWDVVATPWVTRVSRYIDVDTLTPAMAGMNDFAILRFANHTARIAGTDFSGHVRLWSASRWGNGSGSAVGGWLDGERTDSNTPLYQMMPVYARVHLDDGVRAWSAGVDAEAVDRKRDVDPNRMEPRTPGYAIFGLHAAWQGEHVQLSFVAENLFHREYALPLGGVNMDSSMNGMAMGALPAVAGPGRSLDVNLKVPF
ncbi:MAG TPA: TonB-dependent receptor [Acidobacteriaceae bacterium]